MTTLTGRLRQGLRQPGVATATEPPPQPGEGVPTGLRIERQEDLLRQRSGLRSRDLRDEHQRNDAAANQPEGGSGMSVEMSGMLIAPDEGARLPVLDIVHKVTADASGGSLKIEEWGLPPNGMIPPHTHTREDECSYVLQGDLTCYVGGEVVVAPRGSYVIKPREIPHAFYNAGRETVRVLEILTPGEFFEGYFDEYEAIA